MRPNPGHDVLAAHFDKTVAQIKIQRPRPRVAPDNSPASASSVLDTGLNDESAAPEAARLRRGRHSTKPPGSRLGHGFVAVWIIADFRYNRADGQKFAFFVNTKMARVRKIIAHKIGVQKRVVGAEHFLAKLKRFAGRNRAD